MKLFLSGILFASVCGMHSLVVSAWIAVPVTITATDSSSAEKGQDTAAFRITRSGATGFPVNVQFGVSGTASLGSDFTLTTVAGVNLTNEVTIPAGSESVAVLVRPVDDTQTEEPETVTLKLRSGIGAIATAPDSAQVSIIDDDTVVTVTSDVTQIEERHGNRAVFTFSRAGSTIQSLSIGYSIRGTATKGRLIGEVGADYVLSSDPNPPALTFEAGQSSKTISATIIVDAPRESDETIIIALSAPGPAYKLGSASSATVTIKEPALPAVSIAGPGNIASETGPAPASLTVSRVGDLGAALVVYFDINPLGSSTGDIIISDGTQPATLGSDYTLQAGTNSIPSGSSSGTLTIPVGAASAAITVTPIDDAALETTEKVTIILTPKPFYLLGSTAVASVRISDNDRSTVSIVATDANATEGADTGAFTVTRAAPLSSDLRVSFRTPPLLIGGGTFATLGSDFVLQTESGSPLTDSVTIPAGSSSAIVRVLPADDAQIEPDERVEVELIADAAFSYLIQSSAGRATVILKDNDTNIVTVVVGNATTSEGGSNPGNFKIIRTGSLAAALTVTYTMSGVATNGQDYTLLPGTVVIPAGQTSAIVGVFPIVDQQLEDAESVVLTLSPSSAYVLGSQQSGAVVIAGN